MCSPPTRSPPWCARLRHRPGVRPIYRNRRRDRRPSGPALPAHGRRLAGRNGRPAVDAVLRQGKKNKRVPRLRADPRLPRRPLRAASAGRQGDDLLLPKADGSAWGACDPAAPFATSCQGRARFQARDALRVAARLDHPATAGHVSVRSLPPNTTPRSDDRGDLSRSISDHAEPRAVRRCSTSARRARAMLFNSATQGNPCRLILRIGSRSARRSPASAPTTSKAISCPAPYPRRSSPAAADRGEERSGIGASSTIKTPKASAFDAVSADMG